MEKKHHRLRKTLLITFGIIIGLIVLIIVFLSPILKYLIEKYDTKFTGREITLDWAYVNPFTGYVHLDDLKLFEEKSDSVFFASKGISARLNMLKLLKKEYEIKYVTLDKPYGVVIQYTKEKFNFTDLIGKFRKDTLEKKDVDTTKEVKFSLLKFQLIDGTFYMKETMTPINYFIKHVNIESSGMRWNSDTIATKFDLESGIGEGKVEGNFTMNTATKLYNTHVIIRRLDLKIIEQYVKDMANYGRFTAMINADITADGDMNDGRNIDMVGGIGIYNFHFGKSPKEDFASFDKFVLKINRVNPRKKIYEIDSVSLVHPFAKYEKYDHLDNIQNMFGAKGKNVKEAAQSEKFNLVIEIANYVKLLAQNFLKSNYSVNRLGIYRADLRYEDYSINEKFAVALNPLSITGDSMTSKKSRVTVHVRSGIKPYGSLNVDLSINPQDSSDFELNFNLDKVNATLLNPFLRSFTSFPLDRGSIGFKGNWRVKNGNIKSDNHLLVIDPRVTARVKANDNKWIPMRLIMFFVRERGNAIDYQIPITGNLKDPKFSFRDVIWDVVSNIFIKPATTPYRYEIKTIENTIEKTLAFTWELGSAELLPDQEYFIRNVIQFLKDNEKASVFIHPINYTEKEKEYIGFYEAKKKYFLETNKKGGEELSKEDSVTVSRMSPKDSVFTHYMRSKLNDKLMYTSQQLCRAYVGGDKIDKKYRDIVETREKIFKDYFKKEGVENRITFKKDVSRVPFNGFSFYQLAYNGEVPPEMKEAFEELNQYDNEKPREKLKEERKKTRRFFNFGKKERASAP